MADSLAIEALEPQSSQAQPDRSRSTLRLHFISLIAPHEWISISWSSVTSTAARPGATRLTSFAHDLSNLENVVSCWPPRDQWSSSPCSCDRGSSRKGRCRRP